jgi:hypothetical protein
MTELKTFLDAEQLVKLPGLSIATIRKRVLIRYIYPAFPGGKYYKKTPKLIRSANIGLKKKRLRWNRDHFRKRKAILEDRV